MSFYDDAAADALAVLAELGQLGTVTRVTRTGGGPSDPTGGIVDLAHYAAQMAVFPVSDSRIDGTNILAGDFQCIVGRAPIEITANDTITCSEGEDMKITKLGKIAPAGVTVAYDMVIRG
jgi:hypothetical protein